jgi:hypothetical protein
MASFLFIFGNHLTNLLLNRYISEGNAIQKLKLTEVTQLCELLRITARQSADHLAKS